jgi:hypothetical protein
MDMEMEHAAVPALAVVDARFCAADAATLAVAKALSMSGSDFAVTDAATGALVLRVDGVLLSLRRRCVLVDADQRPVLTVQESVRFFLDTSLSRSLARSIDRSVPLPQFPASCCPPVLSPDTRCLHGDGERRR